MTGRHPYVGVSGVVSPEQHAALWGAAGEALRDRNRYLGVGIKATHKPQYDDIVNKYGPGWYPVGDEIRTVLDDELSRSTYNILQAYLDEELVATDEDYPRRFFDKLTERTAHFADALQLDLLHYEKDPRGYAHVLRAMASTSFTTILQCHRYAMEVGPARAIATLAEVTNGCEVDHILFDASGGNGVVMRPDYLLRFLDEASRHSGFGNFGTNFGVAGGLSGENVPALIAPLLREFPDLSWDAEGRLHDPIPPEGTGGLNMPRTQAYLARSVQVLL